MMIEFVLLNSVEELAAEFCRRLQERITATPGGFSLALTGGRSATGFYDGWARAKRPDPAEVDFFWSDERLVPLTNKDSNFKLAHDHLLAPGHVPPARIHPVPIERPPAEAAAAYAAAIRAHLPGSRADDPPRFPLIILGLGEDGHTGSMFPGRDPYENDELLVRAVEPTKDHPHKRVTFTPRLINAAGAVWFLVTGAAKAKPLHDLATRTRPAIEVPALVVDPNQTSVTVFADRPAAKLL